MLLRLLLCASLALAAPARALAANLQRPAVPGNAATPPLGLPAAGAPLSLQPSGTPVPMELPAPELSPGTAGAASPAAASPVHSARNTEPAATKEARQEPPSSTEKPVLAAAEELAEAVSDDAPAAERSAALELTFDNGSAAASEAAAVPVDSASAEVSESHLLARAAAEKALVSRALGEPARLARNDLSLRPSGLGILFLTAFGATTLVPLSIIRSDPIGLLAIATGFSAATLATFAVARLTRATPSDSKGRRARFSLASLLATLMLAALLTQAGRLQWELTHHEVRERATHNANDWPLESSLMMLSDRSSPGLALSQGRDPFWVFLDANLNVTEYVARARGARAPVALDQDLGRIFPYVGKYGLPWTESDIAGRRGLPPFADLERFHRRVQSDPALRADPRRLYLEFLDTVAPHADAQAHAARKDAAQAAFAAAEGRQARQRELGERRRAFYREVPLLAAMSAAWVFLVYAGRSTFDALRSAWRRARRWVKPAAAALLALLSTPSLLLAGEMGSTGSMAAGTLLALSPLLLFLLPRFRRPSARDRFAPTLPRALLASAILFVGMLAIKYVNNAPFLWSLSIAALLLPPWIAADAAADYFGSWLIALRARKRPLQFRLSAVLFATAAAALLTQSILRLAPSIALADKAALAGFGLSGVRRSFTEDHDLIHSGPQRRFHRFLSALKDADFALVRPDNDSYLTRILAIDDAFDLFAQRKAPLSDQEVSDLYARYLANPDSPHWQDEDDFKTLAALHRLWLETEADPKIRRRPDEIYRRYTLERVRWAPEKERADAEKSARLAEANLALYRHPPADLFLGWLASLSVAATLWGFARGRG